MADAKKGPSPQTTTNTRPAQTTTRRTAPMVPPEVATTVRPTAPATTSGERLRAEVYRGTQQPARRPPPDALRSFANAGPLSWFQTAAYRVDLLVRPAFAAITLLVNLLMGWLWLLGRTVGGLLPYESRPRSLQAPPPTLQPGTPVATLVCVGVVLIVVGSLARPIVWPDRTPRGFTNPASSYQWNTTASDPQRAVNWFQQAVQGVSELVGGGSEQPAPALDQPLAALGVRAPGDHDMRGAPSINAAQIDRILASYGSPATGTGSDWVAMGAKYGIDPAYAVAFFIHESTAGTNQNWAGIKSEGGSTHNVGNIICAGYPTCYGRFRDYPSWQEGIGDWYKLIAVEYIEGRGTTTVAAIVPIYAPSFENDTQGYVNVVERMVDEWRINGVP